MANHQSARKRIRANEAKHLRNRYQLKTCRTAIKQLKQIKDKQQAETLFKTIVAMLDKSAMRNILHKNKVANTKSKLAQHISRL
ncbi:MAG: 30S ribosomal protein S20 [Candidatus Amoebophilus sp. 36-38]|nr:MAG: 30S ribosomal protein S20 [Candidatus Amoebophilus sp. 36-38]